MYYVKILPVIILTACLINCGGGNVNNPPAQATQGKIVYADADGSAQADGSRDKPYTLEQAVATGEEVIVLLDTGGIFNVAGLSLSEGQQLLGAGDKDQIDVEFNNGATQTIVGLGTRPIIDDDTTSTAISLNNSNTISGIKFVSINSFNEATVYGATVSNIKLNDVLFESDNQSLQIEEVDGFTLTNCSFNSFGNSVNIEKTHGSVVLRNIDATSGSSGKIFLSNNNGNIEGENITFDGGTEGGLTISYNTGSVTLNNISTINGAHGIDVSGYASGNITIRDSNLTDSFEGISISNAGKMLIENIAINNSYVPMYIGNFGQLTVNNIAINNQNSMYAGATGIFITGGNGDLSISNVVFTGPVDSALRIDDNTGNISVNTLSASNISGNSAVSIYNNQGTQIFTNLDLSNGPDIGFDISSDSSIDGIQITNSTIDQFGSHGIEFVYCDGRYILNNVTFTNIGGDNVHFSYSPNAEVIQN